MGLLGAAIGVGVLYHISKPHRKQMGKIKLPEYKVPKGFKKKRRRLY